MKRLSSTLLVTNLLLLTHYEKTIIASNMDWHLHLSRNIGTDGVNNPEEQILPLIARNDEENKKNSGSKDKAGLLQMDLYGSLFFVRFQKPALKNVYGDPPKINSSVQH